VNYRLIARFLGLLLTAFGLSILPSIGWSFHARDGAHWPLILSLGIITGIGGSLTWKLRASDGELYRKEATAIVGLGWIVCAAAGALPYYLAHHMGHLPEMPRFIDCYFESMSGLTTTGATVLTEIESVPRGILFWRSWTHWIGGMGIIMLFVAILPYIGAGGRQMVFSETSGPVKEGLTPRIKDTARLLLRLYLLYTVAETALLMGLGMDLFDALCHTFGTLATGGFSTRNASIAAFDDVRIEAVIILFMILAASSFALTHNVLARRKFSLFWKDSEWRAYVGLILVAIVVVWVALWREGHYSNGLDRLRGAAFSVVTILSTTGFVTDDFDHWAAAPKCALLALMFVSGCAGSTSSGMKVIRWVILVKMAWARIEKVYQPHRVRKIKINGVPLPDEVQQATAGFALIFVITFAAGAFLLALLEGGEVDLVTCLTASIATLANVGPGFGMVGGAESYAFFSSGAKCVLSALMLLGRIEFYAALALIMPGFWKSN
jgi:trk system potassium uptake protein TrkH